MGYHAVVIGSSTGGMDALRIIIEVLPKNFSVLNKIIEEKSREERR